jgi:lipoprotein NlpD
MTRGTAYNAVPALAVVALITALAGCSSRYAAPLEEEYIEDAAPVVRATAPARAAPPEYVIRQGDTLYGIAWRYKLDYQVLARWNGIGPPYRIYVGQRLRLSPPTAAAGQPPASAPAKSTKMPSVAAIPVKPDPRPTVAAAPPATPSVTETSPKSQPGGAVRTSGGINWQWPAQGRVESADSVLGERGINIFGSRGQSVRAAASGRIVYSGSGLVGYGKLIIIEHNDTYLSAYAHNDKLLVAEGARVVGGQQIAEMGSTGARQVMLHFEIRRGGKPVPPLEFLP